MNIEQLLNRIAGRIENLLENPENIDLQERFNTFHTELRSSISNTVTRSTAIKMIAQHILASPFFEVTFAHYHFVSSNPVAIAFHNIQHDFTAFGLEEETRDVRNFHDSIRTHARGVDNTENRQRLLLELAQRLGIVYTPIEITDFILHSVDEILRDEFGRKLSNEDVHVLDPFTGTGTFIARLIQSDIIQESDLERKYHQELHANETDLLAYYIAAVNIEEAFRRRRGGSGSYEPFDGIILNDTFKLNIERNPTLFPRRWLQDNNERSENQQNLPIQVIVGSPPWAAGQRRAADDNPYVEYPELEQRIRATYAQHPTTVLPIARYDLYRMAIRWATDRIQEQGIVAFVTNGSWIDSRIDSGVRACLAEEFSSIYVLNLRGNARTFGEQRRAEGGNVFGNSLRSPVAITILVKNPNATHDGCKIQYHDIGDYLTHDQKLEALREAVSIKGFSDWGTITPDRHYDWIRQRSEVFANFYPIGTRETRAGRADNAILKIYSYGLQTGRDAYIYNFSRDACVENARRMTQDYLAVLSAFEADPEFTEDAARRSTPNLRWSRGLQNNLRRRLMTEFDLSYIREAAYRPFVKTNCYANNIFIQRKDQMDRIFPNSSSQNRVICIPGIGSRQPFSVLMTDTIPDIGFNERCQCFPRYQYPEQISTPDTQRFDEALTPIDNISDTAQYAFWTHYGTRKITKDDIFYYVYGILHAPSYREQFAYDLSRELPRIPFAPDFRAFAAAGYALANLHLNYEYGPEYPNLSIESLNNSPFWEERQEHFLLGTRAMRFADREERTTLIINEHVQVSGVPAEAHRYVVNGRTPLEWFINRYKIRQDRASGIINDPNGWFYNPRDLITAIERIVYISAESTKIIEALPSEVVGEIE